MISLPDVTVVLIDGHAPQLAGMALRDTLAQIEPGGVVVISDKPIPWTPSDAMCIDPGPMTAKAAEARAWYCGDLLKTSHALLIQWDGWVIDGSMWRDEWLQYDYAGSPWAGVHNNLVGNGGFSMRSKRLLQHLITEADYYPLTRPEDVGLCCTYRAELETDGFRWMPSEEAEKFGLELGPMRQTFGFHSMKVWPWILSKEALQERVDLLDDYARGKSEEWCMFVGRLGGLGIKL